MCSRTMMLCYTAKKTHAQRPHGRQKGAARLERRRAFGFVIQHMLASPVFWGEVSNVRREHEGNAALVGRCARSGCCPLPRGAVVRCTAALAARRLVPGEKEHEPATRRDHEVRGRAADLHLVNLAHFTAPGFPRRSPVQPVDVYGNFVANLGTW